MEFSIGFPQLIQRALERAGIVRLAVAHGAKIASDIAPTRERSDKLIVNSKDRGRILRLCRHDSEEKKNEAAKNEEAARHAITR